MNVNYQYASPSMCLQKEGHTTLGLSPDLSREEKVSFHGKLKNPLIFRDAMLMLREIVISDSKVAVKERTEFFAWLEAEVEKRAKESGLYKPNLRAELKNKMDVLYKEIDERNFEAERLGKDLRKLSSEINKYSVWKDYDKIERDFWKFLYERDKDLWYVLDPVITVHPDQVSFEAFSVDESIYGCLSIDNNEFEMLSHPKLGTTNIDFSAKLAKEMERFRTYSDVELSVNPEGFVVDSGTMPSHVEKKIDLPETWIKGFNQVSSAGNLTGLDIELDSVDMYDICSFLRRNKEKKSPRYMKWILEKDKPVKILFEPFGKELTLNAIYKGDKKREEKIWGRRRWLIMEKILPLAKSIKIKLLGFGMPQFIVADLGNMKMTIGFSSWSSNDWVKGTAFNIMSGFIGDGEYEAVYNLLKDKRAISTDDICTELSDFKKRDVIAGIGNMMKRGEAYFDVVNDIIRFRQLCNEPIPRHLYETTNMEFKVEQLLNTNTNFNICLNDNNEYVFSNVYTEKDRYNSKNNTNHETTISIDEDSQISKLKCTCREFNRGPRNISAPCPHILALYMNSIKFTRLKLEYNKNYKINDIMEMLL